ncbi:MAG: hypothetical protein QXJ28_02665, partial [Candidatus Pacearchaeota archaeon]
MLQETLKLISNFIIEVQLTIPEEYRIYFLALIIMILIFAYAVAVWKFYKSLGKRDLFELNLMSYSYSNNPFLNSVWKIILFIIEYIVILPGIIFLWFVFMSIILLLLSQEFETDMILLISACII